MKIDCSVLILAAGTSSRMGLPKPLLKTNNNVSFLEHITSIYSEFGCSSMVVVMNTDGKLLTKELIFPDRSVIVINQYPELGRFNSIIMGLSQVETKYVFIQNIDNPTVDKNILLNLYNNRKGFDIVKPRYQGVGGHPILISNQVIYDIVNEGNIGIRLNEFLKKYKTKYIDVSVDSVLTNINTKEDYQKYYEENHEIMINK